jgi:hypothetical protein
VKKQHRQAGRQFLRERVPEPPEGSEGSDRVWQAAFLAGFLYALFDFWRPVAQDTDITTVGFLLVALYLALAVVAVVVAVVVGLRAAVRWLWSRRG